jgi:putative ABC transport system substrate-binding protein
MTGVSILPTELDSQRQEILIEAVPGLRRMAALANSTNSAVAKFDELRRRRDRMKRCDIRSWRV